MIVIKFDSYKINFIAVLIQWNCILCSQVSQTSTVDVTLKSILKLSYLYVAKIILW